MIYAETGNCAVLLRGDLKWLDRLPHALSGPRQHPICPWEIGRSKRKLTAAAVISPQHPGVGRLRTRPARHNT